MGKSGHKCGNDAKTTEKRKKDMILQEGTTAGTMDSKGRFQLPTAILREVPAACEGRFVINRGSEKCLRLYRITDWHKLKEKMNKMNTFKADVRKAVRYFMGSASEVRLDGKNRLLIPQPLQEYALLEKDLLITTMNTCIEIWNPKLYNEEMENSSSIECDEFNEMMYDNGEIFNNIS